MLNKKHSRRSLAIFVALALGSGAFFAPASPAAAADVTIDASNPPSDNVTGSGDNGSAAGVVTDMTSAAEVSGNTMTFRGYNYSGKSIYGGFTHGTGRVHGNIVDIYGGAMQSAYGGAAMLGGNAERNKVTITGGTIGGSVYGGFSDNARANENKVTIGNATVNGIVYGGKGMIANTNEVHLTGTTVNGYVYGGYGAIQANDNEVHLNGGVNISGNLYGSNRTSASTGNKLFVEGKDNKAAKVDGFQQMTFKTDGVAEGQTMLQVTGTDKTKVDWEKLEATGAATGITLLRNDHDIILSNYTYSNQVKSKLSADGKSEYDIEVVDVAGHARKITYNRYQFEGNRTLSRSANRLGVMMTWGGLSLVSNTTKKNIVTLDHSVAGVHQYIYGGWSRHLNANSSGDGDSTKNELTIAETAVLAGSSVQIYGGYAEAGKAEGNTVTIKRNVNGLIQGGHSGGNNSAVKNIVHVGNVTITGEVVGGSSSDTANENEVHLTGTTVIGNVSGGAIRMSGGDTNAKDNKVYLNGGVTIQGGLYGGDTDDISEGNKLFVKGKDNKAGLVEQFQKMEFDTTGVNQEDTMLTATNGTATNDINWDTLDVKGTAANGKITLLKNMAGINLTGTAAGQSRSTLNEDGKSEQNLAVVNGDPSDTGKVTAIIAEGYQFKDKTTTSSVTESGLTTTWGGRSIAGNTTTGNEITVGSGNHTNVYGGWTTGAGSTAAGEEALRHSIDNKVTVNGSANVSDTVYGGYTDVTGGRATGNEVKIDKIILGKVIGGKSADGEASGNTVTVNADTRTVVGGEAQGAATGNTVEVNANTTRVIGGNSTGAAASGNTVTVNASPNDVTGGKSTGGEASRNVVNFGNVTVYGNIVGGDSTAVTNSNTLSLTQTTVMRNVTGGSGAVANENIVNLDSANVRGTITGGAANGTGNTLNVKGTNAAGNVAGFQKVNFDATGVTSGATMLNLTIGATTLDKSAIDATGATVAGGITLLHNGNGIAVNGLGATDNILKSETDATTEKNIAALKSGSTITDIRYEGYQFAHVTTPVIDGTDAYGGISKAGNATHDNAITVNGDYTNVYGGHTSGSGTTKDDKDNSYNNTVTITGGRIGAVYGGYTDAAAGTTTGNTVNIGDGTNALAAGTTIDEIHGGNRSQTGNKLVVNATATVGKVENFEKFVFNYKEAMAAKPMLTLTGGASSLRLDAIEANGTVTETPATLVHNAAGLTIADYENKPKSMLNAEGTREINLDVKQTGGVNTHIIRYAYIFKGATAATTVGTDTWGGRSVAGNTTMGNTITVASGAHTNVYGGWTTGAGSTAAGEDALKNSTDNKVTVSGTAAVTGTVYGGFTDAADGKATGNEVTIDTAITGGVVGGKALGEASGNIVTIKANTGAVTGGDGTTTNNNIVNLEGAAVNGTITGGTQATGTGNTLNVKGVNNRAGNIANFQNINFDAAGAEKDSTLLTVTGTAATKVDWTKLTAKGTAAKPLTLLKNNNGIALAGYTGAAKSETTGTTETNIDVRRENDGTVTAITYEGYQFAGAATAVTSDGNTYGGISKAGNSTHDNAITVNGDYTNVYGGHTSGSGTTKDDKDNSYNNTVTITGGTLGAVYGGYTEAATGTTTGNTVNIGDGTNALAAGTTIDEIHGGNRTTQGNKLVVNATATVGKIENFEKFVFNYKEAMAAKPMLTLTGGASSLRLDAIEANGTVTETPATLVHNAAGLTIADYEDKPKSMLNADGTREINLDVKQTGGVNTHIIRYADIFKGATAATTVGTDTWGGRSVAGNTTMGNTITVASGAHTNIYGGWTTGAGSTAAGEDALKNSTDNKVTVSGTAAVTGTVYGGFTDAAGGKAHKNTVTINKTITGKVVGGEAEGEATYNTVNINQSAGDVIGGKSAGAAASNNIINIKANSGAVTGGKSMGAEASRNIINIENAITGAVTGGDGTKTDSNTVNLTNTTVNGTITGGTADGGLGNTLTVKGKNTAQNIKGFRMVEFHADTADIATETPLLTLITGETTLAGKDVINVEGSTASGKITLLHNANGINIEGYTGGDPLQSKTTDTTEKNVSVLRNSSGKITDITYEGYQFSKVESFVEKAVATGKEAYGGISKAGNTTSYNKITVNGNYEAVYGGHTSGSGSDQIGDLKNHSFRNTVTITGGTIGKVYGGYTESADGTTTFNTVNLGDGTNALADGTTIAEIHGGNKAATKNTLVVNAKAQVGTISNFDKVTFNYKESMGNDPMLTLTQADAKFDLNTIDATFDAKATPVTLVHNENGLTLEGYTEGAVKSTLNADGTQETNIDVRKTGTRNTDVIRYAYTFKGKNTASSATDSGVTSTWGGRSVAGNTTTENTITVTGSNHTNIYGGWTTGAGSTAAADRRGASKENSVTVNGSATVTGTIYGGYTDALDGAALKNTVTLEKDLTGSVVAGFSASGEASGNIVNLTGRTFTGNITGGHGTRTNDNIIRLKDAAVTGTVTGGTAANGTGNTLAVAYGTGTSSIGDFSGIRNIHFDLENAPLDDTTHTLLKLTNVSGANKTLSNLNIEFERLSAAKRFKKGDSLTLMENANGAFTLGDNVTSKDVDGVLRKYTFEVAPEAGNPSKLTLTVTKAGITEQAKSLVETRAGLASFVNQGGDYLVASGLAAAEMSAGSRSTAADAVGKDGKRPTASADSAAYQLWAGAGANNMRAESGSYVDSKGWSLGVGWAREDAKKDGSKLLFSPFIEYGRGTYDSYLDDGTHGSGKMSYIGVGILGKLTLQDGMWFEGSVRGGRAKSDYSADLSGTATSYDGSNTYYGIHLGLGKTFALQEGSAIDGYLRYFWSHQNGMRASVKTGGSADDTFDFGSVNSHRLRLGFRYSQKQQNDGEFYAGFAFEHEFDGKAGATMDGEAAPSPSLKGASGMLELGYRFMPENSRVSYDLHLNGWQGKRKGISGGVAVTWAF